MFRVKLRLSKFAQILKKEVINMMTLFNSGLGNIGSARVNNSTISVSIFASKKFIACGRTI